MSDIRHEDFEAILDIIKESLSDSNMEFGEIRSIESNFDTKDMIYKRKKSVMSDGTIIIGEDNDLIAIDISKVDGEVVSFIVKDIEDRDGINNVIAWMKENYT